MRKTQFITGEHYHIYNRGIENRRICVETKDYSKVIRCLKDFNNKTLYEKRKQIITIGGLKELSSFLKNQEKMVQILSYALIPNHYHLILKQLVGGGISQFMHKLGTSYTNYFNKKYTRSGSLFQGPFKAIHVNNNDYLLWLCGYVNGNIEIHKITTAENYKWSSFKTLLQSEENKILGNTDIITSQFNDSQEFKNFVKKIIKKSKERKDLEKYLLGLESQNAQ